MKVQVTENMRFPENKLVITRPWKASTVAPSSPPHPGAVFYWGGPTLVPVSFPSPGRHRWSVDGCGQPGAGWTLGIQRRESPSPAFTGPEVWRISTGTWEILMRGTACRLTEKYKALRNQTGEDTFLQKRTPGPKLKG